MCTCAVWVCVQPMQLVAVLAGDHFLASFPAVTALKNFLELLNAVVALTPTFTHITHLCDIGLNLVDGNLEYEPIGKSYF